MSVIIDDHDVLVQYSPPAGWASFGSSQEYLSTTRTSTTLGSNATFSFEGTSITVFGTVGPGNGSTMSFAIDQTAVGSYDAPALNSAIYHQAFWTSPVLAEGSHSLYIEQDSFNQDSAKKPVIFLDYFLYGATSTSGKTLFVDDNEGRVEYSPGCWDVLDLDQAFNHTAHVSLEANCWVSLTFEGNFVSLYGPVTVGEDGAALNASVTINGGSPVPIPPTTQKPGTTTYNNQLFATSALGLGNHTVVFTALDGQPLYVDYFLFRADSNVPPPASTTSLPPLPSSTLITVQSAQASSQHSNPPLLAALIGGTVGGVVVLALLIAGLLYWRRRERGLNNPSHGIHIDDAQLIDASNPLAVRPFVYWPAEREQLPPTYFAAESSRGSSVSGKFEVPTARWV
ncbi:hypothetical protein B0H17DRAFT_1301780 [Mycena rosella]|uniref:Transmembrane protein n=1 Tax=Mycena rosella TaxID=1033263 RepID=A0AAD7GTJ3_MYCRO|nr:hypothetical protein B0H17DRAFT_1301780 [Mycena rosella]